MSRRLWHFPAMHIFFASPEFLLKIQEFGTTSFKTMMEFEWSAKDEIYGAIDFVDDNLIFYAEMEFEKSLVKVFPEIDITE